MPKRARRGDLNQIAASIVERTTADAKAVETPLKKNPAAVALGRLGGLKGGKARAALLSKQQRSDIARRASAARWQKPTK